MLSRLVLVGLTIMLVQQSALCIFDYTVCVLHRHHHHFFNFASVCERQQQPVVEFCSFCGLQKLIHTNRLISINS